MIPTDRRYTKTHEWIRQTDADVVVGITEHAQQQLGDLTFVDLPAVGDRVEAGSECIVIESVKAASDVYAPVSGEITAVNEALADHPEIVNDDPFEKGWLIKIRPDDAEALDALLTADGYAERIDAEEV